eukprot:scaffold8307_cov71-Phaeocystis_antarctica.AAC.4
MAQVTRRRATSVRPGTAWPRTIRAMNAAHKGLSPKPSSARAARVRAHGDVSQSRDARALEFSCQLAQAAGLPYDEARYQWDGQKEFPEDRLQILIDVAATFELHQPNEKRVRRDDDDSK